MSPIISPSPNGGSSAFLTAAKHITSVEILDLVANPVTLVAAPVAGKAVLPIAVFIHLNFSAVAFTVINGSSAELCLGANGNLLDVVVTSAVTAEQNAGTWASLPLPASAAIGVAFDAGYVEQPFVLANFGGDDFRDGDGSLDVTVYYVLQDVT